MGKVMCLEMLRQVLEMAMDSDDRTRLRLVQLLHKAVSKEERANHLVQHLNRLIKKSKLEGN